MSFIADAFGLAAPQAAIVAKVAEVVAVVAVLGGGVLYLEHRGATQELGKLQKSSTRLLDKAQKTIAEETETHAADNAANQGKLNATLKANSALSDALDQRVRDFDAYRRTHPNVPHPVSGPTATSGGECGTQSCGNLVVRLAERGNDLARSNGELAAALQSAQRDRDSLTGLPK